ncbi:hypothetical protein CONPUDRAFT_136517 [Coniophora puteana RWD-64-598 SS2]|uniref:Uncharacterized protein n=1 Tax=Coniophora puteana (strain RWD-64-598) TaxID=741705 RepID=A0A5M3MRG0_CONPW|nr:uncharacterized protein CONPUDRAFT_136517 [Coniophora puteana RWD-64-598 SS2]EIW81680.1 hypothetical protein CONPUDRAFT_136517 [Coniophora puteana RWD-64-598 SS2]
MGLPHPCSELPTNAADLLQRYSIHVRVAKFAISDAEYQKSVISKEGWDLQDKSGVVIPYHVYWGPLYPPAGVGRVGDVFVDSKSHSLWARLRRGWKEWRGPTPTEETSKVNLNDKGRQQFNSFLIGHPDLPAVDRYLWYQDQKAGWFTRAVVHSSRRQDMRRLGLGGEACEKEYRASGRAVLADTIKILEKQTRKRDRVEDVADMSITSRAHKKPRTSVDTAENTIDPGESASKLKKSGRNDELNVGPMEDVMKAFGKAMEQAVTNHSDDALRAAEVKIQTMQQRVYELQLQHVTESSKFNTELTKAQEKIEKLTKDKEGLEEQLWIEAECHKKTQKRYDKLHGKVQRMHETMHDLFPKMGRDSREGEQGDESEGR